MSSVMLSIEMAGKPVVIIGGGAVALRKLQTLLAAGASVTVVAGEICPEIAAMQSRERLVIHRRSFQLADLGGAFLVIAATNAPEINEQVRSAARLQGALVVVVDNPAQGDCTFPALLSRGSLDIAVSTGGRCPTFAAQVRDSIAERIDDNYGTILDRLAAEREKLLTNGSSSTYNKQVLRSLATHLLGQHYERKDTLP